MKVAKGVKSIKLHPNSQDIHSLVTGDITKWEYGLCFAEHNGYYAQLIDMFSSGRNSLPVRPRGLDNCT